jgi:energy-coupling factor transport system permease protein
VSASLLLIPLFLTSLRRAENLAVAMEARGYGTGQEGRSSMVELRFRATDGVALGVVMTLVLGIVLL